MAWTLLSFLVFPLSHAQAEQDQNHLVDVVYGHKMGVALTMDVFKPSAPTKPNGIGVIWIVSGGWYSAHEAINPALSKTFNDRGFTVFQVVHGSQPKFTLPEIVQDIHRAVRFIRGHAAEYGVDPERLGISGGSAGGHLSLMMAAYGTEGDPNAKDPIDRLSSKVNAAAVFFPPTDFLNYGKQGHIATSDEELRPFWPVFAIPANAKEEERDRILHILSPFYGLSTTTPPILVIHGDADTLVPIQQSQEIMSKLEELKVPHKLVVREGKKHGWPGLETDLPLMMDWFEEYLGKTAARPAVQK